MGMNPSFLDFEQPIAELEGKLRELTAAGHDNAIDVDDEVNKLRSKLRVKTAEIFRDQMPIIPIYIYAGYNLFDPEVIQGIYNEHNIRDEHPIRAIRKLQPKSK